MCGAFPNIPGGPAQTLAAVGLLRGGFVARGALRCLNEDKGGLVQVMTDEEILALHDVILPPRPVRRKRASATPMSVPMGRIVDAVARLAHLGGRSALLSMRRDQHTAFARQLAMYLCREVTHASFPIIGEFFGRDHSTVVHACKIVTARMAAQPEFAEKVRILIQDLRRITGPFWDAAA